MCVGSFHLYEPAELTTLAAYRPGLQTRGVSAAAVPGGRYGRLRGHCCPHRRSVHRRSDAVYCRSIGTRQTSGADRSTADWARRNLWLCWPVNSAPVGDWNAAARLAWLSTVREACERRSIGWALWGYDDSMGFAQHPPAGASALDPEVLQSARAVGSNGSPVATSISGGAQVNFRALSPR